VAVVDTTPSIITLVGANPLVLQCSTLYSEPGVAATDIADPNPALTVNATVNLFVPGKYSVTYTATDASGNTATAIRTIIVVDTTPPEPDLAILPTVTGECSVSLTAPTATDGCAGPITGTTTDPLTYTTQGTFVVTWVFADGNGNTTTQTQTVIVDDVTAPVPNLASLPTVTGECLATIAAAPTATDNCAGVITGTTTDPLTYTTQGTFVVTWLFADGNGNTTTQTQTVIVDDVTAPVPNLASLPTVTGECSAIIAAAPTATDNCAGVITGTTIDPLTYTRQGTFVVTWLFADGNGNTTTQTQTVIVDDVTAPVPNLASLPTVTGECSAIIAAAPTAMDNCAGVITGTTTDPLSYDSQGTFVVTWKFEDGNGNVATQTQTVIVNDATAPALTLPANLTIQCDADNSPAHTGTATAIDNCDAAPVVIFADSVVAGSCPNESIITRMWTATDARGNRASAEQIINAVDTTPPSAGSISAPSEPIEVNTTVNASASVSDTCGLGSAQFAWGDGTTTTGSIVDGVASDSHTYTEPGLYRIILPVGDACGNTAESEFAFVIVIDPDGGFVTGGGTIDSPPGAFVGDPLLAGTAHFGFVSKFKKGSNAPVGATEFQLPAAGLNFHSDQYDWLVVAGHKAIYKGTGTINNAGNFGFLISVVDEKLTSGANEDLFRIRIWDRAQPGEPVVYDNELGTEEDANPTTAISTGSIVIQERGGAKLQAFVREPALLDVRPKFEGIRRIAGDTIEMEFRGLPRIVYALQSSRDLVHWQHREFVLTDEAGIATFRADNADNGCRFYRLGLTQAGVDGDPAIPTQR
jgi:hypothetical protein